MTNEFMGLPIEGDVDHYSRSPVEQRPIEEFYPLVKALLDDPEVDSFGWRQYTPYFNDGDACVFGAWGVWVRPVGAEKKISDEEYFEFGDDNEDYEVRTRSWDDTPASPQHHIDFLLAIEGGHFDTVLETTFGDPADITFKDGKIHVESYDHD